MLAVRGELARPVPAHVAVLHVKFIKMTGLLDRDGKAGRIAVLRVFDEFCFAQNLDFADVAAP